MPVFTARTRRSRGVQNEVDAGVERVVVGRDVGALRRNVGVKSELHLLDGLAAVVASGLPVIAARTGRSRGGNGFLNDWLTMKVSGSGTNEGKNNKSLMHILFIIISKS